MQSLQLRKFLIGLIGVIFILGCTIVPTIDNNSGQSEKPLLKQPESSAIPQFTTQLFTNSSSLSPINQDGVKDVAKIGFTTDIACDFNFSIEQDTALLAYKADQITIAGNESKLYMLWSDSNTNREDDDLRVYLRTSTDIGTSWSDPVRTDLSMLDYQSNMDYFNMDLAVNFTDGSLIVMIVEHTYFGIQKNALNYYKSIDGITWQHLSEVSTPQGSTATGSDMLSDMCLSANGSEILTFTSYQSGSNYHLYFIKSTDGGYTFTTKGIFYFNTYHAYNPAIAMSPTSNNITIVWWELDDYYYMKRSADFGETWTTKTRLDETRGFHAVDDFTDEYRDIQLGYNSSGHLWMYYVFNRTKIYSTWSANDGDNWNQNEELRNFGSFKPNDLSLVLLANGNVTLAFRGDMSGNTYQLSSYFLRPYQVKWMTGTTTGATPQYINWNGTDQFGDFVKDGDYLVRVWIKDTGSSDYNPQPSYLKIRVDNSLQTISITNTTSTISPVASSGIQDTITYTFEASEDINYKIFIADTGDPTDRNPTRVTTHEAGDYQADVVIDNDQTIYSIYVSYQDGDRDIFMKKSTDFGITFGSASPVVTGVYSDDCPAAAIYNDKIYIVFMRLRACQQIASSVYDLFLTSSTNYGSTWTDPVNITMGEYAYAGTNANYYNPDMIITENGTIIIGYYVYQSVASIYQWQIITSVDGSVFSSPAKIADRTPYERFGGKPIALTYDESSDCLYAACSEYPDQYDGAVYIYNSTTMGNSWEGPRMLEATSYYYQPIGITIDNIAPGRLLIKYCMQYAGGGYYLFTGISNDGGYSWSYSGTTFSLSSSGSTNYYAYLRSGRSNLGDIYYTYAQNPTALNNLDVYLAPCTRTVQQFIGYALKNSSESITWNGRDFWNGVNNGIYNVTFLFTDTSGNTHNATRSCVIDDWIPPIYLSSMDFNSMTPRNTQIVTCYNTSNIEDEVYLYYRYRVTEPWNIVLATMSGSSYNTIFSANIPASLTENDVFFYFYINDTAGNSYVTETKHYYEPIIAYTVKDYAQILTRTSWDAFDISVTINSGDNYIDYMYLEYTVNSQTYKRNLTEELSTRFVLSSFNLNSYPDQIDYRLYVVYTNAKLQMLENITLKAPRFDYEIIEQFVSVDIDRKLDAEITVNVQNLEIPYVSKVYFDYKFNNATSFTTVEMLLINGTTFSVTIDGSPQYFMLEYQIRMIDVQQKTHVLKSVLAESAIRQEYIPLMPEIQLDWQSQVIVVIISAAVGAVISVAVLYNRRANMKKIKGRFMGNLDLMKKDALAEKSKESGPNAVDHKPSSEKLTDQAPFVLDASIPNALIKDSKAIKSTEKLNRGRFTYLLSTAGTLTSLIIAAYYAFMVGDGPIAMFVTAIGMILASMAILERVLIDITDAIYVNKPFRYTPTLLHLLLIALSLLAFMYAGTFVEWFNYFVLKEVFNLGSVQIPRLWLSLFGLFLSSMVLLIFTSYKDLNNILKRIDVYSKSGENWKVIFQHKEESISKLTSNVLFKTMIFIATVAFTVISTTQLGRYAEFGMMLLFPFIIVIVVILVTDILITSRAPSVKEALDSILIQKTKTCPKCNTVNLFDNIYCHVCNHKFAEGLVIIEDTQVCPSCGNSSPKNAQFCRICGNTFTKSP